MNVRFAIVFLFVTTSLAALDLVPKQVQIEARLVTPKSVFAGEGFCGRLFLDKKSVSANPAISFSDFMANVPAGIDGKPDLTGLQVSIGGPPALPASLVCGDVPKDGIIQMKFLLKSAVLSE